MTKVEKLNELKTYVRERMDLYNDWSGKSNIKKMFEELETELEELENELKEYRKLQSEVHTDIEKVWMYDGSFPLNQISMEERAKLIERVFYKVANQWID
jgi:archaellum component FlaC